MLCHRSQWCREALKALLIRLERGKSVLVRFEGSSPSGELGWNVPPWDGVKERHGGWAVLVNLKADFG